MDTNMRELHVTCWGGTLKAGTDDIRESPALQVIELLLELGCQVTVHDPMIKSVQHPILEKVTIDTELYRSIKQTELGINYYPLGKRPNHHFIKVM
jgi:UDP-glucose 6-dehydrogenase